MQDIATDLLWTSSPILSMCLLMETALFPRDESARNAIAVTPLSNHESLIDNLHQLYNLGENKKESMTMSKNIFQLYSEVKEVPFAASRKNWKDSDLIIITRVEPKGDYGKAYGFSVHNGEPNNHMAYSSWKKDMELPNVGSYQWRLIDLPEGEIIELVDNFYRGVGKQYGFIEPTGD